MALGMPFGLRLCLPDRWRSVSVYRALVLLLTYLSYCSFHLSRRPFSIVKNVLHHGCPNGTNQTDCGWAPFDGHDSETLFSVLDSSFLFTYAIGMFISGFVAERCNLRYFLAFGMLFSGLLTYATGLAYYYNIHSLWYFIIFQVLSGFFQTTGWPAVVSCVGNWFSKSSRGVIFGLWNSHTNMGNILGAVIAGAFVDFNWGLSFLVPGAIIGVAGFIIFLFLVPYPEDVGIASEDIHRPRSNTNNNDTPSSSLQSSESSAVYSVRDNERTNQSQYRRSKGRSVEDEPPLLVDEDSSGEESPLLRTGDSTINANASISEKSAISFTQALQIPGVIEFSICLFFAKLVSYTFLFWLPYYINSSMHSSASNSAFLSVSFDLGGIIGGVMAGFIVDRTGSSAITCVGMLLLAIPSLFLYLLYGATSNMANIVLQVIAGTFVNGPYALITTAVSAELGTKVKSSQALATVTAIIDGTGSLGAAIGPLLCGPLKQTGWGSVFIMVMLSDALALLSLLRVARQEYIRLRNRQTFIVIV